MPIPSLVLAEEEELSAYCVGYHKLKILVEWGQNVISESAVPVIWTITTSAKSMPVHLIMVFYVQYV